MALCLSWNRLPDYHSWGSEQVTRVCHNDVGQQFDELAGLDSKRACVGERYWTRASHSFLHQQQLPSTYSYC